MSMYKDTTRLLDSDSTDDMTFTNMAALDNHDEPWVRVDVNKENENEASEQLDASPHHSINIAPQPLNDQTKNVSPKRTRPTVANKMKTLGWRLRNACSAPLLDEPGFTESGPSSSQRPLPRLLIARSDSDDDLNSEEFYSADDDYDAREDYTTVLLLSGAVITVGLVLIGLEMFLSRK